MTKGFSYLMKLYSSVAERDGKFYVSLPSREIELMDDLPYLQYFAQGGSVRGFMQDKKVWGEDLTAYANFAGSVEENIKLLNEGKSLL